MFGDAIELPGFEADDNSVPEPYVTTRQAKLAPRISCCQYDRPPGAFTPADRAAAEILGPAQAADLGPAGASTDIFARLNPWPAAQNAESAGHARRFAIAMFMSVSREVTDTLNSGAMPDLALLKDFDITGNLVDDLLQPPVLTGETLKLLSPLVDDLTAVQLAEIIAKLNVNLPWDIREPWLERQAKSHPVSQSNHGSWDLVEWLNADCDTIGTGREPDLDELSNPSLIPDWGDSETMDTFWGDLQKMDW